MDKLSEIPILILAAGSSSRLGSPKQLLKINGNTLLQKAFQTVFEVSKMPVVILGANKEQILPTLNEDRFGEGHILFNENWKAGMSTSIRVGIEFLEKCFAKEKEKLQAVIIMVCDQPFVDVFLLKKIIQTFETTSKPIIACRYDDDSIGVPVLFDISFFEKLKNIQGDKGARALIREYMEEVEFVFFEKGKIDVDTKDDFDSYISR